MSGPDAPVTPPQDEERTPWYRNIWVILFISGILTVTFLRPFTRHVPDAPNTLGQVPEYRLVNQDGQPFGSRELKGHVYVVSFFFTSCVTICPKIMGAMAKLAERYEKMDVPVKLVSITVDPDNDIPEELKKYAINVLGANLERWTFLTGDWEQVRETIVNGFQTHMGKKETTPDSDTIDIGHGGKLILVDVNGGIRGLYETTKVGMDELYHRSKHILRDLKRSPSCSTAPHLH